MSTTDTLTVAGTPAWEHGYTTGYGLADLPAIDRELRTTNLADQLAIDGDVLTEWLDGVHDGILDAEDEARIRQLRIANYAAAQRGRFVR